MNKIQCDVDVYATKNGEYIGKALFTGLVPYSEVVKPDPSDEQLMKLLASDEVTERLVMTKRKFTWLGWRKFHQIWYGFECYFVFNHDSQFTLQ